MLGKELGDIDLVFGLLEIVQPFWIRGLGLERLGVLLVGRENARLLLCNGLGKGVFPEGERRRGGGARTLPDHLQRLGLLPLAGVQVPLGVGPEDGAQREPGLDGAAIDRLERDHEAARLVLCLDDAGTDPVIAAEGRDGHKVALLPAGLGSGPEAEDFGSEGVGQVERAVAPPLELPREKFPVDDRRVELFLRDREHPRAVLVGSAEVGDAPGHPVDVVDHLAIAATVGPMDKATRVRGPAPDGDGVALGEDEVLGNREVHGLPRLAKGGERRNPATGLVGREGRWREMIE